MTKKLSWMATLILISLLILPAGGIGLAAGSRGLGQDDLASCLKLCRDEIVKNRADEAVAWGEKAIALAPSSAEAHYQVALAYDLKVQISSGMGKLGPAKKYKAALEKAVALDPGYLLARTRLFDYYLNAPGIAGGGVDKAKAQADEIAKLDPKAGYRLRAAIFEKDKKWDEAEKELRAGLAQDPADLNMVGSLANVFQGRNDLAGAEAVWKNFLTAYPKNADALFALGQLRLTMNKFDTAKECFIAGLALEGDVMRFRYQLGKLSALSGLDPEEGLKQLNLYLQSPPGPGNPTWADAHWRMGNIYEKTGNPDAAAQAYRKALEINPDHKNAKDSLKALAKKL